jgi:hypothetical protein
MLFIDHHLNNGEKNHLLIKKEKVFNYTFKKGVIKIRKQVCLQIFMMAFLEET